MKLKPAEKSAILGGDHPELVRLGKDCPFKLGEEIVLETMPSLAGPVPRVWCTVQGWDQPKPGVWKPRYSVRDDRPLHLARGSGYTRSAGKSIDKEADVTDEATLKRYAAQGRLTRVKRKERNARVTRDARGVTKQLGKELSKLQAKAERYGIDLTPRFAAMLKEAQAEIAEKRVT